MRVKLDKADIEFSRYIRLRDKQCKRCGRLGTGKEDISGLQCSHFFGRGKESTRFDPDNCDATCFGCHQYWGSTDRESYRDFKIKQLGQKGFDLLLLKANTYTKKDRKMAYIKAKLLIKSLDNENKK